MAKLLASHPGAREVLRRHGVDPVERCHSAAQHYLTLKQVLGRTCPVDDVQATLADLAALVAAE